MIKYSKISLQSYLIYSGNMKWNLSFPKNNPQLTFSCINEDTNEKRIKLHQNSQGYLDWYQAIFPSNIGSIHKSLNWHINLSIMLSPFVDKNKVAKFKARDKKQIFLEQETLSSGKAMGSLLTQTSRKQKWIQMVRLSRKIKIVTIMTVKAKISF